VEQCAIVTVNESVRLMSESPKTGRFYARGERRAKRGAGAARGASAFPRASAIFARFRSVAPVIFHRASAPGEPPAVDSGALRASVTYDVARTPQGWEARVGTPMRTGRLLEFGTSRMRPRPWLRVALLNSRPKFEATARRLGANGGKGAG
jgi:hypothetical protein